MIRFGLLGCGRISKRHADLLGGNHIGDDATLGDDVRLFQNVIVYARSQIGNRVHIHSGTVIGSDGFGYVFDAGQHLKILQIGNVIIHDDVEIGSNACIDRGALGSTVIGRGTKIDNLVQVGHNVAIGRHCLICAQVGISGSSKLEDYVVLGGQAGVAGHITIGRGVKAGGKAGLNADLPAGSVVTGNPAIPVMLERRITILHQRLPELFRRVDALEEQLVAAKKSSS